MTGMMDAPREDDDEAADRNDETSHMITRRYVICRSRPIETRPSVRAIAREALFSQVVLYTGSTPSARTSSALLSSKRIGLLPVARIDGASHANKRNWHTIR